MRGGQSAPRAHLTSRSRLPAPPCEHEILCVTVS
jgi:hypothetical protein